jgi:hypothetical protein
VGLGWGGLGAAELRPIFTTCPHCSYLVEGSCVVCQPGDAHPSCQDCVDGQYRPPATAWYRSQFALAVLTAVLVAVSSSLVVNRIERAIAKRKGK